MKILFALLLVSLLAVLFACLLPVVMKHGKPQTVRTRHRRIRFNPLNAFGRLARPFVQAMRALQGFSQRVFGGNRLVACNIAEGTHCGNVTKLTDAAIATRFLCVKIGSDADHIAVCSAVTDVPIGICTDEADAAEEPVNVALFGSAENTRKVVAGAAINAGALVATMASGKVQTAVATQYPIGRAITAAAADGDVIEIDPILPTVALA